MKRLHFNTEDGAAERAETEPLSVDEENEVVDILNAALWLAPTEDIFKVQRLLNHYQNLSHISTINHKE